MTKQSNIILNNILFKETIKKLTIIKTIRDHLLNCNNIPSFEEFTILTNENNTFVLEIKESLLIKQDGTILIKKIVLLNCLVIVSFLT